MQHIYTLLLRWSAPIGALLLLAGSPAAARAGKVLLVDNPKDQGSTATLLRYAVQEELQHHGHDVLGLLGGDGAAQQSRLLAELERKMKAGAAFFEQLEPQETIDSYRGALKVIERFDKPHPRIYTALFECLTHIVAAHLLVAEHVRDATPYIRRIAALDADYEPDPVLFNPAMRETFLRAFRKTGTERIQLSVGATPAAAVFIDGRLAGMTPLRTDVARGKHNVYLAQLGYAGVRRKVPRRGDAQRQIDVTLSTSPVRASAARSEAVQRMEAQTLPDKLLKLAAELGADEVIVLKASAPVQAVRFYDAGRQRRSANVDGGAQSIEGARRVAASLVKDLYNGGSPSSPTIAQSEQGESSGEASTTELSTTPVAPPASGGVSGLLLAAGYGGGSALVSTGIVFSLLAASDASTYGQSELTGATQYDHSKTTDQIEGEAIRKRGKTRALVADILVGLGVLALAGTAALHLFGNSGAQTRVASHPPIYDDPLLSPHVAVPEWSLLLPAP